MSFTKRKKLDKEEIAVLKNNWFLITIKDKDTGREFSFHSQSKLGEKMDKQGMIQILNEEY